MISFAEPIMLEYKIVTELTKLLKPLKTDYTVHSLCVVIFGVKVILVHLVIILYFIAFALVK